MEIRFNSMDARYKHPFGALRPGERCQLTLEVPAELPVLRLKAMVVRSGGDAMSVPLTQAYERNGFQGWQGEFSLPACGLYHYHFHLETSDGGQDLFRLGESDVTANEAEGKPWQITCCPADFAAPEAFQGAVMYQIFPDRFARAGQCDLTGKLEPYWVHKNWTDVPAFRPNADGKVLNCDFFGGNFQGIREKLDYLKSLSVEVIYLNPICMAYSNHRYDTADYLRPDPMLGTLEDFSALCREAHELGMKIILDGVFSHTGANSVYFNREGVFDGGAYQDPNSPYFPWYEFQTWPDEYTSWWKHKTLPNVDEMEPSYLDFITGESGVIVHWLRLGADGFRLDVADELPDAFIAALRARLKAEKPDALLIGEVWEDASNKVSYGELRRYLTDGELDSVMNYPFRAAILAFMEDRSAGAFRLAVNTIVENYPSSALHCAMNSLSTHDTPRVLTLLGDSFDGTMEEKSERYLAAEARALAVEREKAAVVLQFTLPGAACICYGDEAGLEGYEDPLNRRCFPWGRELKDLQDFYRAAARLKRTLPALRRGDIRFRELGAHTVCFTRTLDGQRIQVAVNGGEQPVSLPLTGEAALLHNGTLHEASVLLRPWGAVIMLEEVKP